MTAVLLSAFFLYPVVLVALAAKQPILIVAGAVIFLYLLLRFDVGMKRQWIAHLRAHRLQSEDDRVLSVHRMMEAYAPDSFRHQTALQVYSYPDASADLQLWVDSKRSLSLFVSEGFFERSRESDWVHFFHSWSTLQLSVIKKQNRLSALRSLFSRWKGPINTARHWWISFWLYPIERILKISKI